MSELRARLDALLNEAEDKAYRVIAEASEAADAVLDSVFEVIDDVQGRVADLKEKADQGAAGTGSPFADLWKTVTDAVDNEAAPVAPEPVSDYKQAYDYLVENSPQWEHHVGRDYWETSYKDAGQYTRDLVIDEADMLREKNKTVTFDLSDY